MREVSKSIYISLFAQHGRDQVDMIQVETPTGHTLEFLQRCAGMMNPPVFFRSEVAYDKLGVVVDQRFYVSEDIVRHPSDRF